MRIKDTDILYFIDYISKRIHIIDLQTAGKSRIENIIDPGFQQELIEKEQLLEDILDFEWIVYGIYSVIASYKNYNFRFLNKKLPWLHQPFLDMLEERNEKQREQS